jgi:hypothetical protein
MADLNERDAKLVQYLSEAFGKEKELETSLEAHIAMATKAPYRNRLKAHLKETKAHAKVLERRIKKLGGGGQMTQTAVGKAMAAAKGPLHMVRGSGWRPRDDEACKRDPPRGGTDGEVPRGADQVIDRRRRHRGGAKSATPASR